MNEPRSLGGFALAALASLTAVVACASAAASLRSAAVEPVRPGPLALGPNGLLYVADDARHQILALTRAGRFRVVAGTGAAGSTGDGGAAVRAELGAPAGMVVRADGTLLFADESTNRVRAIAPDGTIRTIAGDGRFGWARSGSQALHAHLGGPAALAVGPDGLVYVAVAGGDEILRLNRDGSLTRVAGNRRFEGLAGVGRTALNASPSGPNGIAFDGRGDLYIAGFNTKTLLMIDRAGVMRLPEAAGTFYPRGNGGVVAAPSGRVFAMDTQKIVALTPRGERTVIDLGGRRIAATHTFLPNGIAVADDGSIYVDTYLGNGWTTQSVIALITPGGAIHVLWRGSS